ncbi:DUF4352 domain-containing protein [Corynebacterium sp. A21]|uniref:DUF4352 domain-containing protein n=1 Tax=Corynebacterium sp. A21 TaxID=3457318 RepID=UPI003FD4E6DE
MSTPQQPPHDPNQPYIPQGYELAKKKKPFYQRLGCILPLAIIAIIVVIIAVSSGGSDDSSSANDGSSSNGDSNGAGQAAPEGSGPAALGETVSTKKADVTASNLRQTSDALGSYLCVDVAFVNTSDSDSLTLNGLMDWKLADPNGVTITQAFGSETDYDSVEVGPGGNKSGVVCFESDGAAGEYTLTFEEGLSFSSEQAVWVANL